MPKGKVAELSAFLLICAAHLKTPSRDYFLPASPKATNNDGKSRGTALLLAGIYLRDLGVLGQAGMVLFGCYLFFCVGWDLLVEKRSRREAARSIEIESEDQDTGLATGDLDEPERMRFLTPPPTVTEATTRLFDEVAEPVENRKDRHS